MSTIGVLVTRAASSATVSALAGSASVAAHLVIADHLPSRGALVAVLGVLFMSDLVASGLLRARWCVAVRILAMQVSAHAMLASATPASPAHPGAPDSHAGHVVHAAVPVSAIADAGVALVPSVPMLIAHGVVAVVLAVVLSGTSTAGRSALTLPAAARALAGAVAAALPALLVVLPRLAPARRVALVHAERSAVPDDVWERTAPVRRGPPRPVLL